MERGEDIKCLKRKLADEERNKRPLTKLSAKGVASKAAAVTEGEGGGRSC